MSDNIGLYLQLALDKPRPGVTIEQLEEALEERQCDRRRNQGTVFPWPAELDRRRQERRREKSPRQNRERIAVAS